MKLLPNEDIKLSVGCAEKINSYLVLAQCGLPVLKSVYVTQKDLEMWSKEDSEKIKNHLNNDVAMLRYIYSCSCHKVKNGGKIIPIEKSYIEIERPNLADVWLLEATERSENIYCGNISMNKVTGNLHIEILGKGFDVSDLNKGVISPHEILDMPFPLEDGEFGEWWKWAKIAICTNEEYDRSLKIRKKRLESFGCDIKLPEEYTPPDIGILERLREYIKSVAQWFIESKYDFINISCSILRNGRFVFWDIQTPGGKMRAYL